MIFTACTECDALLIVGYESGEEPCGTGVYGRVQCGECGKKNYVERVSFGGRTLSEAEFSELGAKRIERHTDD